MTDLYRMGLEFEAEGKRDAQVIYDRIWAAIEDAGLELNGGDMAVVPNDQIIDLSTGKIPLPEIERQMVNEFLVLRVELPDSVYSTISKTGYLAEQVNTSQTWRLERRIRKAEARLTERWRAIALACGSSVTPSREGK